MPRFTQTAGKKAPAKPTAWSFSRFSDWRTCPRKYKLAVIDRLPNPQNEAMARGEAIHQQGHRFFTEKQRTVPKPYKHFGPYLLKARKAGGQPEVAMTLDINWNELGDVFHPNTWLRLKIDLLVPALGEIVDYKTGRPNPAKDQEQMGLYAAANVSFTDCDQQTVRILYLDDESEATGVFTREEALEQRKDWMRKVKPMFLDTRYDPKPSNACRWCPFSKSKGGPCEY